VSIEFVQRNIKLITKLKSLGLSIYLIGTYIIGVDSSRLKEIAISPRVSAYYSNLSLYSLDTSRPFVIVIWINIDSKINDATIEEGNE